MKRFLIITSGSAQLLIQLATLKELKYDVKEILVIYNGVYRDSLIEFFKVLSKFYGFKYLGEINFNLEPKPLSVKSLLLGLGYSRSKLYNLVDAKFPLLKELKNIETIVTSVRVKITSDILLLSYLNPIKVFYTADGVIDILPKREFKKWNYCYLKNYLKKFPIKDYVYTPYYLENDIKQIGNIKEVSINEILEEIQCLNIVEEFKHRYLRDQVSHVILSQHYHLHERITFEDDVNYYSNIVEFALEQTHSNKVLFKPHPRDLSKKIDAIKRINDDRVIVVDDYYKALPIEIFWRYFHEWNTIFLTGNSSAPLFFKNHNRIIAVGSTKYLHGQLNNRIKEFSKTHDVQYIMLENCNETPLYNT